MKDETMRRGSEVITAAMRALTTLLISTLLIIVDSIDDNNSGAYVPDDEGQYYPDNSGQYIPDYSGRYSHDPSGNYKNDGSGRFSANKDAFSSGRVRNIISSTLVKSTAPPPPYSTTPAGPQGKWKIIRQVNDIDLDGYHWAYETENNIEAEETGKLFNKGSDLEALRANGFFKYTGPDNVVYSLSYTADENGFVAEGKHLPTDPPLPEALVRALEKLKLTGAS